MAPTQELRPSAEQRQKLRGLAPPVVCSRLRPPMDLVIRNATVVTMNPSREVLPNADVVIQGNRIAHVGRARKSRRSGGAQVIDATGRVVIPGLIHGHLHACQTLFRNRADGLELLDWLRQRIWPFEAAHDAQSMRASADLTFVELIKSGATALLDMGTVRHYDEVFSAARAAGIRLTGGKAMMDAGQGVPAGLREGTEESLRESVRLLETWHGADEGRLRYALAPRFVLSCTEALLKETASLAKLRGVRIHTHASENPTECRVVREQTGQDNVVYFEKLGLLGPHTTLAHCVHLSPAELKALERTSTRVTHCPSANLKLASGFAPVPELLQHGISVALGADGAPCNNNLDLWVEMRLAALIHKPKAGPLAMGPHQVLEMATLGGARALGLEEDLGSLEPGKKADLAIVALDQAHATPAGDDVVARLVHSGQSRDVRTVVVDGRVLMRERELRTLDEAEVLQRAELHAARIARAAV
jgi:5-methylthioadenosine/S-adenosylhomocysteine deaminase